MCLIIGGMHIFTLPLSYLVLKFDAPAYSVYIVAIVMEIALLLTRLIILCKLIDLKPTLFLTEVILRIIPVMAIVFVATYFMNTVISNNVAGLLVLVMAECIICSICVFVIGLKSSERKMIIGLIKNKIHK